MMGIWLLMSPFIFGHYPEETWLWANDFFVGSILIVFSLASFWEYTRWAHWLLIPVMVWLAAFGRFSSTPPLEPGRQNEIIVGLVLLLIVIIPNEASQPPRSWRSEEG